MSCKLCGSETTMIRHPKFGNYDWCKTCEFISKDCAFYATEQQELKNYRNHDNSIENKGYVEYLNHFIQNAVLEYMNTGRTGFDFGSGPSPVLAQILERHYGFKMDIYDLFFAKEKTYENKKYDLVTSTEVIEHLAEPLPYFKLFADLMKEDAVLAIMTLFHPNSDELFLDWHYIRDLTHISFYTPKTLCYIAQKVGLKIIYTNDVRHITLVKLEEAHG